MKRLFISTICFLLMIANCFVCYADDGTVVYADDVSTQQNASVLVPVYIDNNKGFVGMKISVKYPQEVLRLMNVSSGSVINQGKFETSITDYAEVDGSFDVMWSSANEATSNGTLLLLKFYVEDSARNGDYSIDLSYSKEDTINAKNESVELICKPISISVGGSVQETSQNDAKQQAGESVEIANDYMIDSVESVLASYNIESLSDDDKQNIVGMVNNFLKSYDENAPQFSDYDSVMESYYLSVENQAIDDVLSSVSCENILKITKDVLSQYGADSFASIPADKQDEAFDQAGELLVQDGFQSPTVDKLVDKDLKMRMLDDLVTKAVDLQKNTTGALVESQAPNKGKKIAIICSCIAGVVVIATVLFIFLRKKQGGKNL